MILSKSLSGLIVATALEYLGREFNYRSFGCVHFVREVYFRVGIILPILDRYDFPPDDFHLSLEGFHNMPAGHSVFFRRKLTTSVRLWTHVAIILSSGDLIHCTRHLGNGVVITTRNEFLDIYELVKNRP
jgi:hypothetical protein